MWVHLRNVGSEKSNQKEKNLSFVFLRKGFVYANEVFKAFPKVFLFAFYVIRILSKSQD